jgi:hypothetical protein
MASCTSQGVLHCLQVSMAARSLFACRASALDRLARAASRVRIRARAGGDVNRSATLAHCAEIAGQPKAREIVGARSWMQVRRAAARWNAVCPAAPSGPKAGPRAARHQLPPQWIGRGNGFERRRTAVSVAIADSSCAIARSRGRCRRHADRSACARLKSYRR